jgi:hypothetical protein
MKRWHVAIAIVACIAIVAYLAMIVGRHALPKTKLPSVAQHRTDGVFFSTAGANENHRRPAHRNDAIVEFPDDLAAAGALQGTTVP